MGTELALQPRQIVGHAPHSPSSDELTAVAEQVEVENSGCGRPGREEMKEKEGICYMMMTTTHVTFDWGPHHLHTLF